MYKDLANYDLNLNEKTPDWWTRFRRTIFKDALIFIALVAFAEISLRVFVPSTKKLIFTERVTGGNSISYNDYGLRDIEFPLEKPDGQRRILTLGNSTTFGSGVALEDTYPKALQKQLGAPWFVINGGGQGSSMPQVIEFMQQYGYAMQPERIIFGFSPAMIAWTKITSQPEALSLKQRLRGAAIGIHKAMHTSYAYSAFNHYLRKNLYRIGVLEDDLTQLKGAIYAYGFDVRGVNIENIKRDYDTFFAEFLSFKQELDRRGIEMVVIGIPSRFELSTESHDNPRNYPLDKIRIQPLNEMQTFARANDIAYIDLRSALKAQENIFIPGDYSHLNEKGLALVADILNQH